MDGFYVAKFKVEKRAKSQNGMAMSDLNGKADEEAANGTAAMKLSEKGELVPDVEARKEAKRSAVSAFDDDADEDIIKSEFAFSQTKESACLIFESARKLARGSVDSGHTLIHLRWSEEGYESQGCQTWEGKSGREDAGAAEGERQGEGAEVSG